MGELHKGASSTSTPQKKSSSLDEDFGNDFLTSWKSTKLGKDSIDFNVETVSRNTKKSFNFDKLDDFELGGGFDKISSFKMDISDLDFSSPQKKADKPKEMLAKDPKTVESKRDNFFSFDFNELDRFSLDSDLLKGEKLLHKDACASKPDCSAKQGRNGTSRSNSVTSTDSAENKFKAVPNSDSIATSRAKNLLDTYTLDGLVPSASNKVLNADISQVTPVSEKQTSTLNEEKAENHINESPREQSSGEGSQRPFPEKSAQENVLSMSDDGSTLHDSSKLHTRVVSLNPKDIGSDKEQETSTRSMESSQSRNNSPVKSFNSSCRNEKSKFVSVKIRDDLTKSEGKQAEFVGGSIVNVLTESQKDAGNASDEAFSGKSNDILKTSSEKQATTPATFLSSLQRDSGAVNSMTGKGKPPTLLQSKSIYRPSETSSQSSLSFTPKKLPSAFDKQVEVTVPCPSREKRRETDQNDGDFENAKGDILKPVDRSATKPGSSLHPLIMPSLSIGGGKGSYPMFSGATSLKRSSMSFEIPNIATKSEKKSDISGSTVPKLMKPSIGTQTSTMQRETKSLRFPEERHALLGSSLKRKTLEEPKEDLVILNPLKRRTNFSTEKRNLLECTPTLCESPVKPSPKSFVETAQSPQACHGNAPPDQKTPIGAPTVNIRDLEIPGLVVDDGIVEKAEACAKELDDICNMLKKKHNEAKELLVRALVNNNSLLMLHHPMFDEKLRSLEKFAASLASREF